MHLSPTCLHSENARQAELIDLTCLQTTHSALSLDHRHLQMVHIPTALLRFSCLFAAFADACL